MKTLSLISHLTCLSCGRDYDKNQILTYCTHCNQPLLTRYFIKKIDKSVLLSRSKTLWRYAEMLPVEDDKHIVSLGEGLTPLLKADRLGNGFGFSDIYIKDESANPTASFKARGLCMAVSMAKSLTIKEIAIPTAGNAGSALSAYCARAGMKAHIFMPRATPSVFQADCRLFGANVTMVEGSIRDCGKRMAAENIGGKWFDVSTLKEPYRLEGKKTMGYEIAEQLDWQLPDVVIYPAGGGTGLIGIWKAFQEMLDLGWIDNIPTRMVCVQVEGCSPIVDAFLQNSNKGISVENPVETIANGLRVPAPFGDKLMLNVLKESNGTALVISDDEMLEGIKEVAATEGVFVAPEGAATWMAAKKLLSLGWLKATDSVVLVNTGSGYKYLENIEGSINKIALPMTSTEAQG
jgi:threonine synthase